MPSVSKLFVMACALWLAQPGYGKDRTPSAASDRTAVVELVAQHDAAMTAGDLNAVVGILAYDFVNMPPDDPVQLGSTVARLRLAKFFQNNTFKLTSTPLDVTVSGDFAVVRATFVQVWASKGVGKKFSATGKTVLTAKRQSDGIWKLASAIWNFDGPPTPAN